MSDQGTIELPEQTPMHDHAWRQTKGADADSLIDGEYRCDLCPATWSM